jgi:hypothetical protein
MHSPDVSRPCPDSITLRRSFCRTITRTVRQSDLTVSVEDTDHKDTTALEATDNELPALFKKMIADYSATGLPTAYIPLQSATTHEEG